uniref:Uncharacterized protein n=1 Tax=viral metagenome TaxID=1070528 RepID=A0A6C0JBW2_9ZZZZ
MSNCKVFNCTCQGLSDKYGTHHRVTWGKAPRYARNWWSRNSCKTRPSCPKCPKQYNLSPYKSDNYSQANNTIIRAREIFEILMLKYKDVLNTQRVHELLLTKQNDLLKIKNQTIDKHNKTISHNDSTNYVNQRNMMYNTPNDILSVKTIKILKLILLILGIAVIYLLAKR